MSDKTEKKCACQTSTCGCAGNPGRCTCGETCGCKAGCSCGKQCDCATAK